MSGNVTIKGMAAGALQTARDATDVLEGAYLVVGDAIRESRKAKRKVEDLKAVIDELKKPLHERSCDRCKDRWATQALCDHCRCEIGEAKVKQAIQEAQRPLKPKCVVCGHYAHDPGRCLGGAGKWACPCDNENDPFRREADIPPELARAWETVLEILKEQVR